MRFVLFACMLLVGAVCLAADTVPGFTLHRVNTYRSEALGVGDFNNDGKKDIIALPYLYLAPELKPVEITQVVGEVDENGKGYRDDFMNVPLDVDQDGWLDVVTCTWFAKKTEWLKNPGEKGGTWERRLIEENGNFESGELCDIDGDGKKLEILPAVTATVWYEPDGKGGIAKHVICDKPMRWGHGVGDVNGDGRPDVLRPDVWFEAPADPRNGQWVEHPLDLCNQKDGGRGDAAQILIYDINADGVPDILASAAHNYGIYWYQQTRHDGGESTWERHLIDDTWSQSHSLALADMDGDGDMDLVSGKRFMAHNGGDPGEMDPPGAFWYALDRKADPVWTKHIVTFGEGIGATSSLAVEDFDGDGDEDIIVTGKWGGPAWFENRLK